MGIEKMKLLARESIYLVNINTDIENTIKSCSTCNEFQAIQTKTNEYHIAYQASHWKL